MSIPINKVLEIINKHKDLEKDLSATNLDSKSYAKKSKEYSDLNEVMQKNILILKKIKMNF